MTSALRKHVVEGNNVTALIFALKSMCGYRENVNLFHQGATPDAPIEVLQKHEHMTEVELKQRVSELLEKHRGSIQVMPRVIEAKAKKDED